MLGQFQYSIHELRITREKLRQLSFLDKITILFIFLSQSRNSGSKVRSLVAMVKRAVAIKQASVVIHHGLSGTD